MQLKEYRTISGPIMKSPDMILEHSGFPAVSGQAQHKAATHSNERLSQTSGWRTPIKIKSSHSSTKASPCDWQHGKAGQTEGQAQERLRWRDQPDCCPKPSESVNSAAVSVERVPNRFTVSEHELAEPTSTAVRRSSANISRETAVTKAPPPESLWNEALSRLESSSSVDDRNRARAVRDYVADRGVAWSSGDIIEELRIAAEAKQDVSQKKAWEIMLGSRTVALREVAARIVECLNKFKEIGDLAVQYDPGHAALPWAAFRLILQVATMTMEQEGQILTAMDAVMHAHVRASIYQDLYLKFSKRPDVADALKESIINQLAAICAFLGLAVEYYSSGSAANTVNGLLNPSALAKCIKKITETELQVERHARVCAAVLDEETRQQHNERLATLERVLAGLRDSFGRLQVESTTIEAGVGQLLEALTAKHTHEIMSWISEVPYKSDLDNSKRGRLTGTCEWLIAHDTYRQWKKSPRSTILWLHGIRMFPRSKMQQSFVEAELVCCSSGSGEDKAVNESRGRHGIGGCVFGILLL